MSSDANNQHDLAGEIIALPEFASEFVRPRKLTLWLPPGYQDESDERCRVIYAHDGQNLFEPRTAFVGIDWGIHEALCRMFAAGEVNRTMVVGIWNTPDRYREYDPQRVFDEYLSPEEKYAYLRDYGQPLSDQYLKFIIRELKPYIDSHYRTLPEQQDTFLLGSSMGAMISAYALCEYPEVFAGTACLSTHWPSLNGKMAAYLADRLPEPQSHRIYFDYGTETLDAQYEPFQRQVDEVMCQRGYCQEHDWLTCKFHGADHSERSWRKRVDIPLRFLLRQ